MTKKPLLSREERTQAVIDYFRGLPEEFGMLKFVLVAENALEAAARAKGAGFEERTALADLNFNRMMIATRMDEVRAAAIMEAHQKGT